VPSNLANEGNRFIVGISVGWEHSCAASLQVRDRDRQRQSVSVCFCVCVNVCGLKPCANTGEITGQCRILLGWQKSETGTRQIFVAYDKTLRMPWYVSYNVFLPP
jgi:hypothetical protein